MQRAWFRESGRLSSGTPAVCGRLYHLLCRGLVARDVMAATYAFGKRRHSNCFTFPIHLSCLVAIPLAWTSRVLSPSMVFNY
eukprot:823121-Amphidinium_carterae.1